MRRLLIATVCSCVLPIAAQASEFRRELPANHFYVIERECLAARVPISLVLSIIEEESSFNPRAKSKKPNANGTIDYGYMGLNSQYIPWFIDMFGYDRSISWDPVKNPEHNLILGIRYVAWLMDRFPTYTQLLHGYNWGPTNVLRGRQPPDRTIAYAQNVLSRVFYR